MKAIINIVAMALLKKCAVTFDKYIHIYLQKKGMPTSGIGLID